MKADQILDAMNDIRDEWILDAETAGKTIPRWLKWISVAACLACAVLAGFLLLQPRHPAPGSSLRPAELPDMAPSSRVSSPTPAPNPSPALSQIDIYDPYSLDDGVITFQNAAWGMNVEDIFSAEGLDADAWRYSADEKLIRSNWDTLPVPDHPEVTEINYCFNWTGPELRYGLNLITVDYDPEQVSYEALIAARAEALGSPGYSGEDKTVWETTTGYALMLLQNKGKLTERLAKIDPALVSNAGEFLNVEAYMEDLQPPNGHFGWTYRAHVEAGLLPDGLTQTLTDDGGFTVTASASLGNYDVEIRYFFGSTLFSETQVLLQAFVEVPEDVDVREWVESFWSPWKDKLIEASSMQFTSPVSLNLLLPEETQREIIDTINAQQGTTDATLNYWYLMWQGYMPKEGLWQYNGTGAALYLAAESDPAQSAQSVIVSETGLQLSVPTVYAEAGDFTVDTPYDPQVDDGVRFDNVVFGFFNHWALDPDIPCYEPRGFVWCILRDPIEAYDFEAVENEIFLLNRTILATDDKYVYTLIHPHLGGFPTDQVLAHTHYARLAESPAILQDFIDRNGLTSDGQWEDLLREKTIDPCYKLLYG